MFTIVRANEQAWAFTLKEVKGDKEGMERWFQRAEAFGCKIDCKYLELDSQKVEHYHGILYIPKGFYRKKLMMKGYHLKLEELFDRKGWMKYITKDATLVPDPLPDATEDELIEHQFNLHLKKRIV